MREAKLKSCTACGRDVYTNDFRPAMCPHCRAIYDVSTTPLYRVRGTNNQTERSDECTKESRTSSAR